MHKITKTRRGHCSIGIWHPKSECNQGTLWRSAFAFQASSCFTVGPRFTRQASDTTQTWRHLPMLQFETLDDLLKHLPYDTRLVGVECGTEQGRPLTRFCHPERACYLLGAEDHGLAPSVLERCHLVVEVPNLQTCLNVAATGTLVLYDRFLKEQRG